MSILMCRVVVATISEFDCDSHLALVASLVGRLDAADGEREAALVLEEERAESPVGRESVGAHREDVDVAVPDPRNLRFRGASKGGLLRDPILMRCHMSAT